MRVSLTCLVALALIVAGPRDPPATQDAPCPALVASLPSGPGIYVAAGNGEYVQLTDEPFDLLPQWSADGSRIAFTSIRGTDMEELEAFRAPFHWMLYTMNADGSNQSRVPGLPLSLFSWSPDGSQIAYVSSIDDERNYDRNAFFLYVMNVDGSSVRRLTADGVAMFPSWSPDGSQLVYGWDVGGVGRQPTPSLHTVAVTGGEPRQLTESPRVVGTPLWSPRGGVIAFTRQSLPQFSEAVFVVSEDGTGERLLEEGARLVSWLSNGEEILVASGRELWTVHVSSGARSTRSDQPESFLSELPCQNGLHEIVGLRLRGR